jgi:hypothetical protein
MKTLSVSYEKPARPVRVAPARLRFRVWHMLAGSLLVSLVAWAGLIALIDMVAGALR